MNPNKKVFITFLSFVLAMLVIACLCIPITPTPSPVTVEPSADLTGQWQDPETLFIFTIAWGNGSYQVTSVKDADNADVPVTSQSWDGSKLTWSITNPDGTYTLSYETNSVSGDSLFTNWSDTDGASGTETLQRVGTTVTSQPPVSQEPNVLTSQDSLTLTSAEAGVVTNGTGVSITIPAGAVPLNDDGSIGSMIFSIAQDSTTVPSLPGGYVPVGPVVNLGPEGFVFEQPVILSLPIPSDVDPNTVLGATYYDPGQDTWFLVPGSVDATNRTVEVETTHLSRWSCWGYGETTGEYKDGGYFKVQRPSATTQYKGPDNQNTLAVNHHGICVQSITYLDLTVSNWWLAPQNYTIMASSIPWTTFGSAYIPRSDAATYWMPYGTYQLIEIYGQDEVNLSQDPLYIPKSYQMWRPLPIMILAYGQTLEFPDPDPYYNQTGWTLGRPPCWGTVTTSVGVGGVRGHEGVQVTLNWNSNADIDLHVIEPGGEEIFFNYPVSTAGGTLDRDNKCDNFELGKPENIFWTTPPNGTYTVNVVYYEDCGGAGTVNFTVRVCISGNCGNPISGTVNTVDPYVSVPVTTFTYP